MKIRLYYQPHDAMPHGRLESEVYEASDPGVGLVDLLNSSRLATKLADPLRRPIPTPFGILYVVVVGEDDARSMEEYQGKYTEAIRAKLAADPTGFDWFSCRGNHNRLVALGQTMDLLILREDARGYGPPVGRGRYADDVGSGATETADG